MKAPHPEPSGCGAFLFPCIPTGGSKPSHFCALILKVPLIVPMFGRVDSRKAGRRERVSLQTPTVVVKLSVFAPPPNYTSFRFSSPYA